MSGWQTGGDDFNIQEFEAQEDRMIELACFLVTRDDTLTGKWDDALDASQEYQDYVTQHQFNYAALMEKLQPEALQVLAGRGQQHYRDLFGQD